MRTHRGVDDAVGPISRPEGRAVILAVAAAALGVAPSSRGEIARFDSLTEGFAGTAFVSDGVTFANGVWFPGGVLVPFAIDDGSGSMRGLGFGGTYSPRNVMTVGGYVTTGVSAFIRVHSWEARIPGRTFTQGSVDVFYIDAFPEATVKLEAILANQVVATDSFTLVNNDPFSAVHRRLEISAPAFDRMRFVVTGGLGGDADGILAVFDNVRLVPAPAAWAVLAALSPFRRRR